MSMLDVTCSVLLLLEYPHIILTMNDASKNLRLANCALVVCALEVRALVVCARMITSLVVSLTRATFQTLTISTNVPFLGLDVNILLIDLQ